VAIPAPPFKKGLRENCLYHEQLLRRGTIGTVPRDPTSAQAGPARELSRRAGFLLVQLGTHAHRRFAERLTALDLHPRHFGMLSHLAASEGQSQQALSMALGIHRSAVVALVDDLEQRGLAERRRDPVDRRAYTLYLTPAGRDLLADLKRIAAEHEAELLTALDASERSQLISLLQRVAESQGLAAGVHPNLEPRAGEEQTARKDGKTLRVRTRQRAR
jgi:DNA-binding MarR family transcriptional regulator